VKRSLSLAALLFALCAFPASAILDTNSNGLSDLWERMYNEEELFLTTDFPYGLQDDLDGDGWTNAQEAAAGTNPFDPNPPDGLLRPDIVHIPAVWIDTDFDEIPDTISTPEAITITWPQIPGKFYTLLFSPDLVDWLPVGEAFIGSETEQVYNFPLSQVEGQPPPPDKQFWRIKIEDVDSDGDGLTDAEEDELGTDPDSPQTVSGYPDMWLAEHYWATILSDGLSSLDLDGDPDGDGLTNAQEDMLGTNRYVADNDENIVQEEISNGEFLHPLIGSGESPEANWDYWEGLPADDEGKTSWTTVVGTNIEYQTITPKAGCGQYVELKADPDDHYGIKQTVGTRIGVTYILVLDCRARAIGFPEEPLAPEESNFEIRIEGTTEGTTIKSVDFSSQNTPTPPGEWTTVPVVFTASDVTVKISLVPVYNANDQMGCLVDNLKLAPMAFITPAGDPVLSPVDAGTTPESIPDGANEFTFNDEPTGIITLTLKACVPGISLLPAVEQAKFTFEADAIGNSTFAWGAANPEGKSSVSGDFITATATYTGLPQNNSDFGLKKARIKYDAATAGEAIFEVFFPRDATNHPLGQVGSANWFYYWQEGDVCGIPSDAIYDATNPGWFGWTQADQDSILRLCPSAPTVGGEPLTLTSTINIPGSDPPATYGSITVRSGGKGIQCLAETIEHELYHITMYADLGNNADGDGDGVADSSEATLGGVVSSPLHSDTFNLSSLPGYEIYSEIADEEVRAMKKECDVSFPVFPLKDWANPGCQSANQHGPKP